jgi:hypothetical protein
VKQQGDGTMPLVVACIIFVITWVNFIGLLQKDQMLSVIFFILSAIFLAIGEIAITLRDIKWKMK